MGGSEDGFYTSRAITGGTDTSVVATDWDPVCLYWFQNIWKAVIDGASLLHVCTAKEGCVLAAEYKTLIEDVKPVTF